MASLIHFPLAILSQIFILAKILCSIKHLKVASFTIWLYISFELFCFVYLRGWANNKRLVALNSSFQFGIVLFTKWVEAFHFTPPKSYSKKNLHVHSELFFKKGGKNNVIYLPTCWWWFPLQDVLGKRWWFKFILVKW